MVEKDSVRPGPGSRTKTMVVKITEEQSAALQRYARERSLTVSSVVRQMLDDILLDEE